MVPIISFYNLPISEATHFEANYQIQIKLTRKFYQQRGLFCIDITWGTTTLKQIDLNIFNLTKNIWTQRYNIENSTKTRFSKNIDNAGIHTVVIETYESSEIITINNCSNTCKAIKNFKNRIELLLISN